MVKQNRHLIAKQGFTLAELLIVVAIIAVLVAIGIPIFTSQLEKSREATDLANVRAAYTEVVAAALDGSGSQSVTVTLAQTQDDWQSMTTVTIGGISHTVGDSDTANWKGIPKSGGSCTVSYNESVGIVFDWTGYTDSAEVQEAKTTAQTTAKEKLTELEQKILDYAPTDAKAKLDTLSESSAKFTLSDGTVAYYKKSSSDITTMDADKSSDGKSWINFTLDNDGNIVMYNYVNKDYSYSTYDARADDPDWTGSAVIK